MRSEERWLLGPVLWMLLLAAVQGCGSAGMDGELEFADDSEAVDPDPADGPDRDPDDEADPGTILPPPSDLRPELVMLCHRSNGAQLWATNPNDVFVAGSGGFLAHFDGARWRPFEEEDAGSFGDFEWIFGVESDQVYVGGSGGRMLQFDGESWNDVAEFETRPAIDLWGRASNDVYALTDSGLMHFDGVKWDELAERPPEDVAWTKITGNGQKHVALIGSAAERNRFTFFDGVGWHEPTMPEVERLRDVWSAGPEQTYAVGREGVILRFDGKSVIRMDSGTDEDLHSVHGTPGGEVFVVGDNVMLRLDGEEWLPIEMPPALRKDGYWYPSSVVVFEDGQAMTAGMGIYSFDGDSWETRLPYSEDLSHIWASGPDDVFFTGTEPHRFDGFTVEREELAGLDVSSLGAVWGVGGRLYAADYKGRFFRYDGEHWGVLPTESEGYILDMFGTSEDDIFAVGQDGTIMHFDGASWAPMVSGTQSKLRGVWASAPDDVYAVGDAGTVLHYDGSQWAELFGGGGGYYLGITGFDATQIIASNSEDVVFLSDGVSWRPEPASGVRAVHGTSPENVYAAGYDGLSHYDGEVWTRISSRVFGGVQSIFAVGPREVYVGGKIGVVRFSVPPPH